MPPSPPSPSPSPILTHWADKQFDVSMASILVLLVVATILAFTIHALLRFLLRLYRRHLPTISTQKIQNPNIADSLPSLVFTSTTTTLAGGAECAICLSEFADGERVRVMPACNHGFHVKCVEGWLAAKASCPTCRTSCRPVAEV